jgi:hypothetical protein
MMRLATAIARAPAVHFLVLGALLFALVPRGTRPTSVRPPIVLTQQRVVDVRDDYRRTMGVDPTSAELDALLAREADEEMLYREALLLGLDRGDRAVEWRVIEKMRFFYGDAAGTNDEALARGLALGLQRDDVVVRNALVTKIRLLAKAASRVDEPSGQDLDRELTDYLERHRSTYAQAARLTLTQVFLSADKHGAALENDARDLLAQLRASGTPPAPGARLGDPFLPGAPPRGASRRDLAKLFGDDFAAAVSDLDVARWSEPIRSRYGLHLVWVSERDAAAVPSLDAVRPRVLRAYRAERRSAYLAKMMAELRTAYEVRIDHAA